MKWVSADSIEEFKEFEEFMLKWFYADLHVHTCLSPCADLTMSPKRIIKRAREVKVDIVGICDHNSAENVRAARNAGSAMGVKVLAGMEVNTVEEVHVICLFDETEAVVKLQDMVYESLTPGENREDIFGEQIVANEFDEVEGFNKRLLIGATAISLKNLVNEVHRLGGVAIASHIDREVNSLIGQLGYIPEDLELDALEISSRISWSQAVAEFPGIEKFPIISSSDAHFLEGIGSRVTVFSLEEPTSHEIGKALRGSGGRTFRLEA
jgi:PHP family Zn ribbon phosphoesterase